MGRLALFSISSLCLALVASIGLAAYTATRPGDSGLAVTSASARLAVSRSVVTRLAPARPQKNPVRSLERKC